MAIDGRGRSISIATNEDVWNAMRALAPARGEC
jgi:hypothetical protein